MRALTSIADLLDLKGRNVHTIHADAPLPECARTMSQFGVSALIVTDASGELRGIVSSRDLVAAAGKGGREFDGATVSEVMARDLRTTTPAAGLEDVERMMIEHNIRHLPVLEDGKVAGVVSRIDVLRHYLSKQHSLSRELEAYISGVYPG